MNKSHFYLNYFNCWMSSANVMFGTRNFSNVVDNLLTHLFQKRSKPVFNTVIQLDLEIWKNEFIFLIISRKELSLLLVFQWNKCLSHKKHFFFISILRYLPHSVVWQKYSMNYNQNHSQHNKLYCACWKCAKSVLSFAVVLCLYTSKFFSSVRSARALCVY